MRFKVRLLFAGFFISFLLVGTLTFMSFFQTGRLAHRVKWVEHTHIVVNTTNVMAYDLSILDKTSFRFLLTLDSAYVDTFENGVTSLYKNTETLRSLCADNKAQEANIIGLQSDEALYISDCRALFSRPRMPVDVLLASSEMAKNREKMQHATQQLRQIAAIENQLLQERTIERESNMKLTTSFMRALSVIFGVLTLLLSVLLFREFRRRVAYQSELQLKISEIEHSRRELEHIAYATSHDLQEPLRKIRVLTDRWYHKYKDALGPDSSDMLERLVQSAKRMQELVGELMILASLNADSHKRPCALQRYINVAAGQLKEEIAAKNATLHVEEMPEVDGYPDQLKMLFRNLIDNSLKFSRTEVPLQITISARKATSEELPVARQIDRTFHCIVIEDNGIGFDNQQTEKMFGIFRRLQTNAENAAGKGTGLAICRRIMTNHNGFIIAHGFRGEGATFKLYFPAES